MNEHRDDSDSQTLDREEALDGASPSESSPFPFLDASDDADVFTSTDLEADHERTALRNELDAPSVDEPARGPLATLDVEAGGGETRQTEVETKRFLIGRNSVDLVLDDDFVSPWHAQLFAVGDVLLLEDMESDNGVFLRIADQLALADGDEIVMGHQRFVFRTSWHPPEIVARDRNASPETPPEVGAPTSGSPVRLFHYFEGGRLAGVYRIGDGLSIGREEADLVCRQDPGLASTHAIVVREDDTYFLRDLGSEYGTFIRVHDAVDLVDGDCFVVGRTRIQISYH
jgi:pSer/pThr/pTyr-binding forkhead associated (FHA) protein